MQLTKHWAAVLDDYAIDLAWSQDGAKLAAASAAGSVTIFQLQGGEKLHVLPGHEEGANCIAWSAGNSGLLASGGQDGQVKIWDTSAGQHVASAKMNASWVEHLAWRPRRASETALTDRSGVAKAPAEETQTGANTNAQGALETELCLAASAGKQFSFIRADGSLQHSFKPAPKTISAIAWHPTGACVAAAYFGGVCLWDSDDFVVQKEFPYGNGIQSLTWSPDGKWLVSGNQDPSVHLWIPETDVELHMSGYEGKVKSLSFDCTSRWLATSGGQDACLWDCAGAGPEGRDPVMLPHPARTSVVAFQNTHSLLATASEDGSVMVWSPERKQPLRATIRMPNAASKLVWSPDDRYLAIGSEQGAVYVLKCEA